MNDANRINTPGDDNDQKPKISYKELNQRLKYPVNPAYCQQNKNDKEDTS